MAGRVPRLLGCRKTSYTFRSSSVNRLSHKGMILPPICHKSLALLWPAEGYYSVSNRCENQRAESETARRASALSSLLSGIIHELCSLPELARRLPPAGGRR